MKTASVYHKKTTCEGERFPELIKMINGDSMVPFRQLENFVNPNSYEDEITKKTIDKYKGGACAGLLLEWYQYLISDKNLLDAIQKDLNSTLLQDILQSQDLHGSLNGQRHLLKQALKNNNTFLYANNYSRIAQKWINQASSENNNFSNNITDHMHELEQNGADSIGLHTLCFGKPNHTIGHIIGWTKIDTPESGYLLFDANMGELFFYNYNTLIMAINNNLLNCEEGTATEELDVYFKSYYTPGELENLNEQTMNYIENAHNDCVELFKADQLKLLKTQLIALCQKVRVNKANFSVWLPHLKKHAPDEIKKLMTRLSDNQVTSKDQLMECIKKLFEIVAYPKSAPIFFSDSWSVAPYNQILIDELESGCYPDLNELLVEYMEKSENSNEHASFHVNGAKN